MVVQARCVRTKSHSWEQAIKSLQNRKSTRTELGRGKGGVTHCNLGNVGLGGFWDINSYRVDLDHFVVHEFQ